MEGLPYALGGALALGMWGIPRATVDVDINVFVEDGELSSVVDALRTLGIEIDEDDVRAESVARGMFVVRWGMFRIDVFTPSIEFSWEAARNRVRCEIEGRSAWFLSAESIAVFKLLFFRAKDIVDLQQLLVIQGAQLDVDYVRRWMVEMMGEDDERVLRWDELLTSTTRQG